MPLSVIKESLQDQLGNLQDLKDNPAYQLCLERFSNLLAQSLRQLESASELSMVFKAQGEVVAYRKAISALDDLISEGKRKL